MPFQQNKNELVAPQLKVFSIEPFVNYCCKNDYRRKYFGQECNNYDDPETKQSSQWKNMTPPPSFEKSESNTISWKKYVHSFYGPNVML